tara:strand:+ start:85 stop:426 length:342 start_codon:yes stop_codon:yes gene_type:complete
MNKLFENFRQYALNEGDVSPIRPGVEDEGVPKVECHCECHDCVFNKNLQCVAEKINLDFAQTNEGKWICECLTYEVAEKEPVGPNDDEEYEEMMRRKYDREESEARNPRLDEQ